MNRQVSALLVLVALFGQQACKSDGGTEPPPSPIPTSVQISQTTVSLTALGAQATLSATVRDQNNNPIGGASVIWSSDDTDVVTVNASGTVTAVGVGSTTIRATSGSASGTATVMVSQQPAAAEPVGGNAQSGTVGQALGMALTVQINDAGGNPIPSVSVSFVVTSGGGSVADPTVPTDATGQASTTWTLGLTAGEQQVSASIEGGGPVGTFTATATADVAFSIAEVSGNMQQGPTGAQLPDPIVVKVADQFGNGVQGEAVAFAITDGGDGSLVSNLEITDDQGEASTQWTLSSSEGPNSAEAGAAGLSGDPVMFTATGTNLAVTGVSPDPMIEGGTATISGNGFSPVPGNTTVTVDGVSANVTSVLLNTIEIDVPTFDCRPARMVDVVVTVSGVNQGIEHPVRPEAFVDLPVGQQLVVSDPADFCFQFDATAEQEGYLIGVSAVSEVASSRTEVSLSSVTSSGSTAPPQRSMLATPRSQASPLSLDDLRRMERLRRHRVAEAKFMAQELAASDAMGSPVATGERSSIPSDLMVGDIVSIRVPSSKDLQCSAFTEIQAVVRLIGTHGIWLEDVGNDVTVALTLEDFQELSDLLDNLIHATNTQYVGASTDIDGNNLIAIVVTKEVNAADLAGFVSSRDLSSRASCAASDEGEIYYSEAPTQDRSLEDVMAFAPIVIAHELVHIVQLSRRRAAGALVFQSPWELEGQATAMETQVGIAARGLEPMDIPNSVVWDFGNLESTDWFLSMFLDIAFYFGLDLTQAPPAKLSEAPWDCTWLEGDVEDDECLIEPREVYGVPAAFLWWLFDQFGPTFTGGVGGAEGIHQAFIDNSTLRGFENIEATIGVPIEELLVQWHAALLMDNRQVGGSEVPNAPRLNYTTWDFFSIFENTSAGGTPIAATPKIAPFADQVITLHLRSGSPAYFLAEGAGRLATAFRARDGMGAALPSTMRFWLVRYQ